MDAATPKPKTPNIAKWGPARILMEQLLQERGPLERQELIDLLRPVLAEKLPHRCRYSRQAQRGWPREAAQKVRPETTEPFREVRIGSRLYAKATVNNATRHLDRIINPEAPFGKQIIRPLEGELPRWYEDE